MEKVEDDFMEMAPTDPEDVVRFVKEVPYWTAKKHGKKYRLMYQIYTHPKYIEHGKKFFEGVNERYTEYAKRLGAYCRFDLVELPEQRLPERPSQKEIHAALEKEAQAIRTRIPKGAAVIAMCVEGKLLSSEALARQLAGYAAGGTSKVCFLVGGSFGLDEGLKREASLRLSMSPMTFPHHLARVMLAEQIYRACTINAGTQYHK